MSSNNNRNNFGSSSSSSRHNNSHNSSSTNNSSAESDVGVAYKKLMNSRSRLSSNIFGISKEHKNEISELRDQFKKNNRVREYASHQGKVHSVAWSADGRRLASGSFDRTIIIYLLETSKLKLEHTYKGHTDSVDQLCWHVTNPELLATASGDRSVRIWDARLQKSTNMFTTKGENINITWSGDGNFIGVGNKDDLITIIDIRTGLPIHEEQFKFEVNEITFDPTSKFLYLTNGDGNVCIYSFPEFELEETLKAHTANCICIEFSPDGSHFAIGSADAIVSLWEVDSLACVRTFTRLDWPVRTISFNHNGTLLATASEDLVIDIAHVETAEKVFQIPVETPTFTVSFHPTKNILAFACDDKDKYERDRDSGVIKVFGLPSE